MTDDRPIGVFDSGVGGLTVLKSLMHAFPQENFIYIGDTARLPYGGKSLETIHLYLEQNLQALIDKKVKLLVVACNSASSALMDKDGIFADNYKGIPLYNVIEPGCRTALKHSQVNSVAVIGTRATVDAKSYLKTLSRLRPGVEVNQRPCPLLVPLIEEGWTEDPLTNLVLHRYLGPLTQTSADTLVLGCTHYPILVDSIKRVVGSKFQIITSGEALGEQLNQDFKSGRLMPSDRLSDREIGELEIYMTDLHPFVSDLCKRVIGNDVLLERKCSEVFRLEL